VSLKESMIRGRLRCRSIVSGGISALDHGRLATCPGIPTEARLQEGPVAVIECAEEIPCNPCEMACARGAIRVGHPITNLPVLDTLLCIGCGECIADCPGLAIFVVDASQDARDVVTLPYEMLPVPCPKDVVALVDRRGEIVGSGRVTHVRSSTKTDRTAIITVTVRKGLGMSVRSIDLPGQRCA